MDQINQLQYISVCGKVTEDLNSYLAIKDKDLTEYVVHRAIQCKTEDEFIEAMNEDEAGFTIKLARSVFSTVHEMLPEKDIEERRQKHEQQQTLQEKNGILPSDNATSLNETASASRIAGNASLPAGKSAGLPAGTGLQQFGQQLSSENRILAQKFPGLAIPNTSLNTEEIDIDLDDDLDDESDQGGDKNNKGKESSKNQLKVVKRKKGDDDDDDDDDEEEVKRVDKKDPKYMKSSNKEARGDSRNRTKSKRRRRSRSRSNDSRNSRSRHKTKKSKSKHKRSHKEDRRHNHSPTTNISKSRSTSQTKKSKTKKKSHRHKHRDSRSTSRDEHRHRNHSKKDRGHRRRRRRSIARRSFSPPKEGEVYPGYVTLILKHGVLVQLTDWKKRCEGLVHVNNMDGVILRPHADLHESFELFQDVKVCVVSVRENKMYFRMKGIDQKTGLDTFVYGQQGNNYLDNQRNKYNSYNDHLEDNDYTGDVHARLQSTIFKDSLMGDGKTYGSLTGIKLDTNPKDKRRAEKRLDSPDLWELSRLQYFAGGEVAAQRRLVTQDMDAEELNEEDIEIEIEDKEPLFLAGQTSKAGVVMSPIRVVKLPDGSLHREALKSLQLAKERRENREKKERENVESQRANGPGGAGTFGPDKSKFERGLLPGQVARMNNTSHFSQAHLRGGSNATPNEDKTTVNPHTGPKKPGDWKFDRKAAFTTTTRRPLRRTRKEIRDQQKKLPIFKKKKELIKAIRENKILVVIGETGSGKTTQMTQYLYEAGFGGPNRKIGCTQPRRIAARSVAKRVADEMGVRLGQEVGYSIRFEDYTSSRTAIKYMTDGMLLREALLDKDLNGYGALMLDEAHERTIQTDVLFGLMKETMAKRNDLKLIVTSATLNAAKFSSYFFDCEIYTIPGNTFEVQAFFIKEPTTDYMEEALSTVLQIHLTEPAGDILLFLTGQEEIDTACQLLTERMKRFGDDAPELVVLPVYSALPTEKQSKIFEPAEPGTRKCVIATNIAEASLTIDGIYYVIDPGFAKIKCYNPKRGMDSLVIAPISQASAKQRKGRAGRVGPGKCYRLYTEDAYKNEMMPVTVPEIQRTNLATTVLLLKAMGINDLINFDFMDPPPVQTLIAALESLYALGALNEEGLLTKLGRKMAEFPLEPQLAKMLLTSVDLGCSDEIITIVAMLTVGNVFYRPKEKQQEADKRRNVFCQKEGDHLTLLAVYEAWKNNNMSQKWCHDNFIHARAMKRAHDVRKQLLTIMERYKLPVPKSGHDSSRIRKAISAGFFAHAARRDPKEGYKTLIDGQSVFIHPSSALFQKNQEWVVYHELVLTSKEYIRDVCAIEPKWLVDVAPNFFRYSDPTQISHRKKQEKLEPLHLKHNSDNNAWRLSRRRAFNGPCF